MVAKSFTVRLPADLYEASVVAARHRGRSLDALVQESLAATLRADEEPRLSEAFGLVGTDADEADVEFAAAAQGEVASRDA